MRNKAVMSALAAWVALIGCDPAKPTVSEAEAKERASRLYANAMDDFQAGRVDAALTGFRKVVKEEPRSFSAHFQLATLLQDVKKDYVGALAHYRSYLELRPESDKAVVAAERMKLCERQILQDIEQRSGGAEALRVESEKHRTDVKSLTARVAQLEAQLAAAEKKALALAAENEMKGKLLKKLAEDEAGRRPDTAKEALAQLREIEKENDRRRTKPTDAELLDEDDAKSEDRIRASADVKKLRAEMAQEEAADAANKYAAKPARNDATNEPAAFNPFGDLGKKEKNRKSEPARPETYVVQPGDTLFRISTQFYGTRTKWRAIRDANRATIPPDGRLRAGQTIRLP